MRKKAKTPIEIRDIVPFLFFFAVLLCHFLWFYHFVRPVAPNVDQKETALLKTVMSDQESFLRMAEEKGLEYNDTWQCLYARFEPDEENILHMAVTVVDEDKRFRQRHRQQHLEDEVYPYTIMSVIEYGHLVLWLVNDSKQEDSAVINNMIAELVADLREAPTQ